MDETSRRAFGSFVLNLSTGELHRDGVPVPLQRQPSRVLATLVTRAGELVPREDLRAAVWADGTHVDFNRGLNYCVRYLRAVLEDDARQPRFIETVARQGYRFMEPVSAPRPHRPARRLSRQIAGAAAVASFMLITLAIEGSGRNQQHHDAALAMARVVHDFIF